MEMDTREAFNAKLLDENHNIKMGVRERKDVRELVQKVSDYIASLPLSATQNNELVQLLSRITDTIELAAFTNGSLFAAGLAELSDNGGLHS